MQEKESRHVIFTGRARAGILAAYPSSSSFEHQGRGVSVRIKMAETLYKEEEVGGQACRIQSACAVRKGEIVPYKANTAITSSGNS